MQITHEQARRFISMISDEGLSIPEKRMLDAHLASCSECRSYANSMQHMELLLRPLLQRQWSQLPIPLSLSALTPRPTTKPSEGMLVATRIAALGVMFVVFLFSAWQLAFSNASRSAPASAGVPLIPIPSTSTQLIGTTTQTQTCAGFRYTVQENDTLESIGIQFLVAQEELILANELNSDQIQPGTKLTIPTCHFTPTAHALTTTFTPILNTITSTPGG